MLKAFSLEALSLEFKMVLKYIAEYGPLSGLYNLFEVFSCYLTRKEFMQFRLRSLKTTLLLRANSSDIRVFNDVFIKQDYDLSFLSLAPRLIIDGGANVGCSSLFFAQRYPNSLILAVEPEISNFKILYHNVKFAPNIVPIHAALWNRRASLMVENPKDEKWAFRIIEAGEKESPKIRSVTIMDLMAIAKMEYIDILKLDIEGAEKELFESNYETWLDKVSVIIIELHDRIKRGSSVSVNRATSRRKYRRLNRRENVILIRDKSPVNFASPE